MSDRQPTLSWKGPFADTPRASGPEPLAPPDRLLKEPPMPRLSIAVLATALLSGLLVAPAAPAQSGPPGTNEGGRHHRDSAERARRPSREAETKVEDQAAVDAAAVAKARQSSELLDKVVAVVNDGIVTQSELDDAILNYIQSQQQAGKRAPTPEELRAPMLEHLVLEEVQLQRADRIGVKVSDEQLNAAMADMAERNKLTLSQLPDALARQGMDYASVREDTRKQIAIALLQQKEVRQRINITPRELDQFMERLKKLPNENDEYDVSDILIALPLEATQAQVDAAAKKAQDVYERTGKEDFARLAVTFSNAQTALKGGELGWRKGGNLPTDLAETIVALKPGEISKPISTTNGFHILKLNGIRHADGDPVQDQVHVRHILMKPNALQDDATVKLKLEGIRQKILNGEDFAAFASSMSEDSGSAVNGGEMDWTSPDTFVPEFAKVVAGLKVNEISEPFRTQYGWHIVQLLGRRKFDTTEDNLRERAYRQLAESKAEEETESWLRELRSDAYINTNP
jgi:peptidyl-prolyl cis-trans isomerase SurA